jgi:hypothetical protein
MSDMLMVRPDLMKMPTWHSIAEGFRNANIVAKELAGKIFDAYESFVQPIQKALVAQNIVKIVNVPLALTEIVKNRHFMSENDQDKRIDKGLEICNNVQNITGTTGAFVFALDTFEIISFPVEACAKPFTALISFLSVTSLLTQYRTCMKVWKFMLELNESKDINEMIDFLTRQHQAKDEKFITDTFNTTEEKLMASLSKIQGKEKMEEAIKGLKDRVKNRFISSTVSLAAAVISLIGTVILLGVTSAALGWVMLGVGIAVDIEQFLFRKFTEYQFSQAVDLKRTTWEWITC